MDASYQRIDAPFVALSEKDYEMEKMLESMKAMGLGGSLYNKDDLSGMMQNKDDYEDEYEGLGGFDPYGL